ncbi:hypothetical protein G4O51_10775 [Candidatus Bathyarchaeota archaeon A05DMB-2]|jgi:hypothetical protein|nr:hypothetical protein [Candidatus Bathyarchaeota archaeon A05DMB-2]
MAQSSRELLSIGAFLIIVVVAILLFAANLISLGLVIPVILVLSGCWALVLAGVRASNPQKYERGAFSTMSLGLLLIAAGGGWYLFSVNLALYALALILLVVAAIAIAAAVRQK